MTVIISWQSSTRVHHWVIPLIGILKWHLCITWSLNIRLPEYTASSLLGPLPSTSCSDIITTTAEFWSRQNCATSSWKPGRKSSSCKQKWRNYWMLHLAKKYFFSILQCFFLNSAKIQFSPFCKNSIFSILQNFNFLHSAKIQFSPFCKNSISSPFCRFFFVFVVISSL